MHTTHFSGHLGGGGLPGGDLPGGWVRVPCVLSHNPFDVTGMLSQHQLRANTNAAAYIVLVGHVTSDWPIACWDTHPPVNRMTDRQV